MKLTEKGITKLAPGRYGDGDGLYLEVTSATNKCWLLRWQRNGRERWLGLGSVKLFTLKEARAKARQARQAIHDGIDPLEARAARRDADRKDAAAKITFKDAAERFLALHENTWRNAKHRAQWRSTVEKFAFPELGPRPVRAIDTAVINAALAPIWNKVPVTASRTRDRIERVLKWVTDGMPLPVGSAAVAKKHHAALPYSEIPVFMTKLRARADIAALALEFTILTAVRTSEALGSRWDEIDQAAKVWTVPGARTKSGREHRVPLSDRVMEILATVPHEHGNPFVFIGFVPGRSLGDDKLRVTLRALGAKDTVHGFRSTFKDWASETTNTPNMVSEAALGHLVGDKTEEAYRRGDLLDKRRHLMEAWAVYCCRSPDDVTGVVVDFKQKVAGGSGL